MKRTLLTLITVSTILAGCQQAEANDEGSGSYKSHENQSKFASLNSERASVIAAQVGRWAIVPTKPSEPTMILDTVTGCVFSVQNRDGAPVIKEPAFETNTPSACRLGTPVATVSAK